jgi:hypothetical protein
VAGRSLTEPGSIPARLRWVPTAREVGGWWGPALHLHRAAKTRFSEEIDAVALAGRHVLVAAEAKWTAKPMDASVLTALLDFKLPAMTQAGFDVSGTDIILTARSGFSDGLVERAAGRGNVRLIGADEILATQSN